MLKEQWIPLDSLSELPAAASYEEELQGELRRIDLAQAAGRIRTGGYVTMFLAALNALVVSTAIKTAAPSLARWNNPGNFLDVAILVALAIGIFRKSVVAAILMLTYFMLTRVLFVVTMGLSNIFPAVIGTIIFGIPLYRAARATFAYRRLAGTAQTASMRRRRWPWLLAGIASLLLIGILATTALVELGFIPNSTAVPGNKLPHRIRAKLVQAEIVSRDETILFFYSDAFLSVLADGNLFTNQGVISYTSLGDDIWIERVAYSDIADLSAMFSQSSLENSMIWVTTTDGREFMLWVSAESGLDRVFFSQLEERWKRSGGGVHQPATLRPSNTIGPGAEL
jgi:hypothetical protein